MTRLPQGLYDSARGTEIRTGVDCLLGGGVFEDLGSIDMNPRFVPLSLSFP